MESERVFKSEASSFQKIVPCCKLVSCANQNIITEPDEADSVAAAIQATAALNSPGVIGVGVSPDRTQMAKVRNYNCRIPAYQPMGRSKYIGLATLMPAASCISSPAAAQWMHKDIEDPGLESEIKSAASFFVDPIHPGDRNSRPSPNAIYLGSDTAQAWSAKTLVLTSVIGGEFFFRPIV
tara:strand:+ start:184 stop:726 length:543 start_codon:yes stop_codon:yes gene_type:complete